MKLSFQNESYTCTIVRLDSTRPLDNMDNLVAANFYGMQALVPKTYLPGLYALFSAESQLTDDFCRSNNLYRKPEMNQDQNQKGYIEHNRRVRAVKMRGHISSAMLLPLTCFDYLGVDASKFKEGDTFDHIDGVEVCRKYINRQDVINAQRQAKQNKKADPKVDEKLFPQHTDTAQYFRHKAEFGDKIVSVTQKLEGTSVRFGKVPVRRRLSFLEKFAQKFGANVKTHEIDFVVGSRRVIKTVENKDQGFYSEDIWTQVSERFKEVIPNNFILYGEIIGYVDNNTSIQPRYTYNLKPGQNEFYCYRVSVINEQGLLVDLSYDGMTRFCEERGIKVVPLLWSGWHHDLNIDDFMDKRYHEQGYMQAIPLSDKKTVDEGVVVRAESLQPILMKAKSPEFLGFETKILDSGNIDIESEQS